MKVKVTTILYKENIILNYSDEYYIGTCFNEDNDMLSYQSKSLDRVKEWIDKTMNYGE